jgi:predicted nucleic acid-binding protein
MRREGETAYLLDREGLSRWVRGERRTGVRIKDAHRLGVRVMTTSMTLIEAYDVRTYLPARHWALSRVHVEPVTEEIAQEAIGLLEETALHGHRYAIDAALAAVALRQPGPVTVFTSDEDDLRKLCGDRVVVRNL